MARPPAWPPACPCRHDQSLAPPTASAATALHGPGSASDMGGGNPSHFTKERPLYAKDLRPHSRDLSPDADQPNLSDAADLRPYQAQRDAARVQPARYMGSESSGVLGPHGHARGRIQSHESR